MPMAMSSPLQHRPAEAASAVHMHHRVFRHSHMHQARIIWQQILPDISLLQHLLHTCFIHTRHQHSKQNFLLAPTECFWNLHQHHQPDSIGLLQVARAVAGYGERLSVHFRIKQICKMHSTQNFPRHPLLQLIFLLCMHREHFQHLVTRPILFRQNLPIRSLERGLPDSSHTSLALVRSAPLQQEHRDNFW